MVNDILNHSMQFSLHSYLLLPCVFIQSRCKLHWVKQCDYKAFWSPIETTEMLGACAAIQM